MVTWNGHDDSRKSRPLRFRMENSTNTPIWVLGFNSLNDPAIRLEVFRQEAWRESSPIRDCGNGIGWVRLEPGGILDFNELLDTRCNPNLLPMRVGLVVADSSDAPAWFAGGRVVWSEPFTPDVLIDHDDPLQPLQYIWYSN